MYDELEIWLSLCFEQGSGDVEVPGIWSDSVFGLKMWLKKLHTNTHLKVFSYCLHLKFWWKQEHWVLCQVHCRINEWALWLCLASLLKGSKAYLLMPDLTLFLPPQLFSWRICYFLLAIGCTHKIFIVVVTADPNQTDESHMLSVMYKECNYTLNSFSSLFSATIRNLCGILAIVYPCDWRISICHVRNCDTNEFWVHSCTDNCNCVPNSTIIQYMTAFKKLHFHVKPL